MRKGIIENADKELVNTILECILNILNGNIKLSEEQFNNLKPYKHLFRKLLAKNQNLKYKKKILIQKGGFLQILLPAIISGLSTLISSVISNQQE
jgi:hypothetical protein